MAARSVNIVVSNFTEQTLFCVSSHLDHGEWSTNPPETIGADTLSVSFGSESDGFLTGAQGQAIYAIGSPNGPQITLNWDIPYAGGNSYSATPTATPEGNFAAAAIGTRGDNSTLAFVVFDQPKVDWMQQSRSTLGGLTLREICIPGSHDAGMSVLNRSTAFGTKCNTLTQLSGIGQQLAYGSRFFDLRPVISAGAYATGHYSEVASTSWQGGNGQSFEDIVSEINAFTASNNELIILSLSHDLDTDKGNSSYAPFTQTQWNGLFQMLSNPTSGLKNLYVSSTTPNDLTALTLSDYIGNNQPAVVVIVDPDGSGISLGQYANQGFYPAGAFPVYNAYSDTDDVDTMSADQLKKMAEQRGGSSPAYFLLSWTLTQGGVQAATCGTVGSVWSVLDLANYANSRLYSEVPPDCQGNIFPNIVYIDGMDTAAVTALALKINKKAGKAYVAAIESVAFPNVFLRIDGSKVARPEPAGSGTVNAQYAPFGPYEKFLITPLDDGNCTIGSLAFPTAYLRLDGSGFNGPSPSGGGVVNCQFDPPGPFEHFVIEPYQDGKVRIRSVEFPNCYLRLDGSGIHAQNPAGEGHVNCQYSPPGPWEVFKVHRL